MFLQHVKLEDSLVIEVIEVAPDVTKLSQQLTSAIILTTLAFQSQTGKYGHMHYMYGMRVNKSWPGQRVKRRVLKVSLVLDISFS